MSKTLLTPILLAVVLSTAQAQFVSTTNTGLGQLESLVVDPQGNRYVCDRTGNRVLKLDPDNTPTVYSGSGFNLPTGLVRMPSGEIYVVNHLAGTVSVIPPGGGPASVYASGFSLPRGITADPQGNLYVGEYSSQRILKVAPGGAVTVVVGNAGITGTLGPNNRLEHLAIEPTGDLIATIGYSSPGRVYRISLPSGTPSLLATSPDLAGAFAINVNQNTGNIYITGVTGHRILSLTPQGAVSVVTGDGTNATLDGPLDLARFSEPSGITVDPDGNIWISQFGGAVRRIGLQSPEVPTNGLRLWLRADRGLLRNGNSVTQWLDQSGSANHATPTGAISTPAAPQFVSDLVNGYPAVRFNGVNTGLTTPTFQTFPNKRGTIFSVVRVNGPSSTSSGGYGTIAGTYFASSGTAWQYGGYPGYFSFYDGLGFSNFNVAENPPDVWGIATFMRDSDSGFQFYKSGVSVGGGSLADNQPSPLPVHIGWNDFSSPSTWEVLNGDIAELIIYDGALSPAELEQVHAYLADKYSFNGDVSLPTAQDVNICGTGSAMLTATGGDAYRWYDSPDGTVPLSTDATFMTPVVEQTTTFYVANFNGQLQSQRVPVTVTVLSPGAACDDGDPNTENDALDENCDCTGEPLYEDIDLALNLAGGSQHVSTLANPITIGPAITVEAWIKPTAFNYGEFYAVCDDPNNDCIGGDYKLLSMRVDPDGTVTAQISPSDYNTRAISKTSLVSVALGQWVHVAATMDLATNEGRIYLNGVEVPTIDWGVGTGSGSFVGAPAVGALQISGAMTTIQYPFSGQIDELRVWNTALPGTSIHAYHCLKHVDGHPQLANLVAHYQMEDGAPPDEVVVDVAGGNNGVLTNVSVASAYVPSEAACTCPLGPVGSPCDDGDENTINDVIAIDCSCSGTPVNDCEQVVLEFHTGSSPADMDWELEDTGTNSIVASGTGAGMQPGGTEQVLVCLFEGCYKLRVNDAGDGLGGYLVRHQASGSRIIDNADNMVAGLSEMSSAFSFCLPMGERGLTSLNQPGGFSCDRMYLPADGYLIAQPDPLVVAANGDGYQYWIFDPNGTYSRRVLQSGAVNNGWPNSDPNDACYLRYAWLQTQPMPEELRLNARVRTRVSGMYGPFGPACAVRITDLQPPCPTTKLVDDANSPLFSCGVVRSFGGSDKLHAFQVEGADRYRFRFVNSGEGFARNIAFSGTTCTLNWSTLPLQDGVNYQVSVQVSFDGGASWCPFGPECAVTIQNPSATDARRAIAPTANLWPNPNDGSILHVGIGQWGLEDGMARMELMDMTGRVVGLHAIPLHHGIANTSVQLGRELANGTYLVRISMDGHQVTERMVISR